MGKARRETRLQQQNIITKYFSNVVPTGVVMCKRKQRLHANCPICNHENKDRRHILQCQDSRAVTLRGELLKEFQCWLNSIDTHPDIIYFVISGLISWFSSSIEFRIGAAVESEIASAFRSHLKLGWESLIHGLLSRQRIQQQQQYYSLISSRKLGTRWGIRLTGKL